MNGIVGVAGYEECAKQIGFSLNSMQRRGFSGAGILSHRSTMFHLKKNLGSLSEVFTEDAFESLVGDVALGSVQLLPHDNLQVHELQPFLIHHPIEAGMVFEGSLSNEKYLRDSLFEGGGYRCVSRAQAELVLGWVVQGLQETAFDFETLKKSVELFQGLAQGAYCAIGLLPNSSLFGFRGTFGTRPLLLGKRNDLEGISFMLVSDLEVCRQQGYTVEHECAPGEMILIEKAVVAAEKMEWVVRTSRLAT